MYARKPRQEWRPILRSKLISHTLNTSHTHTHTHTHTHPHTHTHIHTHAHTHTHTHTLGCRIKKKPEGARSVAVERDGKRALVFFVWSFIHLSFACLPYPGHFVCVH